MRAAAEGSDDLWQTRPNAFELHGGLGTPIGFLGLTYDRVLLRRLSAAVGFGVGSGRNGGSLQLAAGMRFRILQHGNTALSIGADYSTGGWRYVDFVPKLGDTSAGSDTIIYSDRVHWLTATLGWELRSDIGFVLRTYAGVAAMLNPSSRECVTEDDQSCALTEDSYGDPTALVLGLALGFTL